MNHGWPDAHGEEYQSDGCARQPVPSFPHGPRSLLLLCDAKGAGGQPRVAAWSPAPVDVTLCAIERLERPLTQVGHFCSLTYLRPNTAAHARVRNTPLSVFIRTIRGSFLP